MTAHRNEASAPDLDYLDHLARESARFATVLERTSPDAEVPTCPGWNADDLLWHLGRTQWFWGTIVREGVDARAAVEKMPPQPASRSGLEEFYQTASHELGAVLAAAAPQAPAWTWSDDKTVGFIRRRQAHEALIHRLDAELTAHDRTSMDPRLSADGVDEAIRIMFGGDVPEWGTFDTDGTRTLRISTADTGDSWFVSLGRFTGTDPDDQRSYDQPGIRVTDEDLRAHAAAAIQGTAEDLDGWLWGRPARSAIERSGDPAVLDGFDAIVAKGVK